MFNFGDIVKRGDNTATKSKVDFVNHVCRPCRRMSTFDFVDFDFVVSVYQPLQDREWEYSS